MTNEQIRHGLIDDAVATLKELTEEREDKFNGPKQLRMLAREIAFYGEAIEWLKNVRDPEEDAAMSDRGWKPGSRVMASGVILEVRDDDAFVEFDDKNGVAYMSLNILRPLPEPDQRLTPEEQALIEAAEKYYAAHLFGFGCPAVYDFMDAVANLRNARKS